MTTAEALALLTTDDVVAITLFGEARNEPVEGRIAVACCIRNRVTADLRGDGKPDWWGEGYRDVCLKPWQFSCWTPKGGAANFAAVMASVQATAKGERPTPILAECLWIAHGVISGVVLDRVRGSTHYLTTDLYRTNPPDWAKLRAPTEHIHSHLFFRGVER